MNSRKFEKWLKKKKEKKIICKPCLGFFLFLFGPPIGTVPSTGTPAIAVPTGLAMAKPPGPTTAVP